MSATQPPSRAGVNFPPPFVYVAAFVAGLLLQRGWPLFFLPLALLVIDRLVIAREEKYLASAFPQEYGAYRSRVRRWL